MLIAPGETHAFSAARVTLLQSMTARKSSSCRISMYAGVPYEEEPFSNIAQDVISLLYRL
jgi:hypothetical protein